MSSLLVYAELETNPWNRDGSVLALYFSGSPTATEVTAAARSQFGGSLAGLAQDEEAKFEVRPTPVSERAGLARVLVYNAA